MDQKKIDQSIKNFKNKSNTDSYLILVQDKTGGYLTGQEFADNCGPGTDRELVGIKQADGSVHYYGSLKDYDDTTNN